MQRGLTTRNSRGSSQNNTGNPTKQAKQNYTAIGLGNDKGSFQSGRVHKQGDVTAGPGLYTPCLLYTSPSPRD